MEVIVEKDRASSPWTSTLVMGLVLVVIGVLLIVGRQDALQWILIIAGVLIAASGAFSLYGGVRTGATMLTVTGAIALVIGVALVVMPNLFSDLLMILLAVMLLIIGVISVFSLASPVATGGSKILSIVIGIILIVMGVYALMNLDDTADIVMIVIGGALVLAGLLDAVEAFQLRGSS